MKKFEESERMHRETYTSLKEAKETKEKENQELIQLQKMLQEKCESLEASLKRETEVNRRLTQSLEEHEMKEREMSEEIENLHSELEHLVEVNNSIQENLFDMKSENERLLQTLADAKREVPFSFILH